MKYQPSASAEFPNDNTDLHEGALWVRASLTGRPRAFVRPETLVLPSMVPGPIVTEEPEADSFDRDVPEPELEIDIDVDLPEPEPLVLPEPLPALELEALEPELVAAPEPGFEPESEPEAAPTQGVEPDGFAQFVTATVRIALDAGGSRAAAALPVLLNDGDLADLGADATLSERLLASGIAEGSRGGLRASAAFAEVARAWRAVLRGESGDLAACGTAMLDDWALGLLMALLDAPESRRRELKRELRRHGVAAFGMIDVAA